MDEREAVSLLQELAHFFGPFVAEVSEGVFQECDLDLTAPELSTKAMQQWIEVLPHTVASLQNFLRSMRAQPKLGAIIQHEDVNKALQEWFLELQKNQKNPG